MNKPAVVKDTKQKSNPIKTNKAPIPGKSKKSVTNKVVKKGTPVETIKKETKIIENKKVLTKKATSPKEVSLKKESVPSIEIKPVKEDVSPTKIIKPIKEEVVPSPTIANRMLNGIMSLFVIGLVLWILSSIVLRTAEIEIAVKAQSVEREIERLELDIRGLDVEIMELKKKDRLMEIAKELGLEYDWDRIKVVE